MKNLGQGFTGGQWPGAQLDILECHFAADRQAMTALGTTAIQDLAAVFGGHAGAKTVFVHALAIPGLEGTLHKVFPS